MLSSPEDAQLRMETALLLMANSQTAYTLDLFTQILTKDNGVNYENIAMSPLSIAMALAMAAVGARGDTLDQMVSHLKHSESHVMHQFFLYLRHSVLKDGSPAGGPAIDFASCVLIDKMLPLDGGYRQAVRESYGAEVESVDFRNEAEPIRVQVNEWVREKTRGKISVLFPQGSVTESSQMLLANALYFKGDWLFPFDRASSRNIPFYLLNGMAVTVPMMTTAKSQCIKSFPTFKVLRLPYKSGLNSGNKFSMYVLLPNERTGLFDLESHLDGTAAAWLMRELPLVNEPVPVGSFLLPCFKISYAVEASDVLKNLGLTRPFAPDSNFSDILGKNASNFQPLSISQIFHKALVEVNEEGTVAAAATGMGILFGSSVPILPREDFVADHAFLFLIIDDVTGVIMFIGRLANPAEER